MAANVMLGITCVIAIFFPALAAYEFVGIRAYRAQVG
jgi:hypothetical protein